MESNKEEENLKVSTFSVTVKYIKSEEISEIMEFG